MFVHIQNLLLLFAISISLISAHDGVHVNNKELEVPGFPDCIQTSSSTTTGTTTKSSSLRTRLLQENIDPSMTLKCYQRDGPIKIGCIGDSITAGAHSSGGSHTYPSVLQKLLGDNYAVTNLGACGSTMMKQANSPYWKRPQFQALTKNTWDILIIMLGTNDAKDAGSHGAVNWPHNCMGTKALDCPFAKDYVDMIQLARTLGPSPKEPPQIYTMIPPPLMQQGAYGMNATVINQVFPTLIPQIAKWAGLLTDPIDVFTEFGGHDIENKTDPTACSKDLVDQAKCPWYCDVQSCDQCHPDDAGYYHMAKAVQRGLGLQLAQEEKKEEKLV